MALEQISCAFHQCKNFENQLRFDKVTESLKVGTFFETQCITILVLASVDTLRVKKMQDIVTTHAT